MYDTFEIVLAWVIATVFVSTAAAFLFIGAHYFYIGTIERHYESKIYIQKLTADALDCGGHE